MTAEDGHLIEPIVILLIEPNPGDTRLFTESFDEAQLKNRVHTVSDGEGALDFLHQRGEYADYDRPDLILLEPRLPGKGGKEVLSELEGDPVLHEIPVIVLTSSKTGEELVKAHGIDADHYVRKPVQPEDFFEFVDEIEEFWLSIVHRTPADD